MIYFFDNNIQEVILCRLASRLLSALKGVLGEHLRGTILLPLPSPLQQGSIHDFDNWLSGICVPLLPLTPPSSPSPASE